VLGKQVVHFLHVGKTGGTAIKYALGRHWTTPEYGLNADFDVLVSRLGLPLHAVLPTDDVSAHRSPKDLDRSFSQGMSTKR
jgi:hypothetical protein